MSTPQRSGNRYFALWLPAIGVHALHQLEESISFFQWYLDHESAIPGPLRIVSRDHAAMIVEQPATFALASVAQISAALVVAALFRRRERATRALLSLYILGLSFFLVWHVVTSALAHSYAPIMVTCLGGLFLIPSWLRRLWAPAPA